MAETSVDEPIGSRERKKRQVRNDLLSTAGELFAERGYDNVTVAEIADGAGVTVKTLFQHFGSKQDLLLAELDAVHGRLLAALRGRPANQSPVEAVRDWLLREKAEEPDDGLERFHRTVGTSEAITALRRRLYDDWENAIVAVLAEEGREAPASPRTRLLAAQIVAVIRVISSPEVREFVNRHPEDHRRAVTERWMREAAAILDEGFDRST